MFDYFTRVLASEELFGSYAWFYFVLQIVTAALGAYFIWLHTERSQVWRAFYRRLGMFMIGFGAVGTILGSLRLAAIAPFNLRLWFYLLLILEIAAIAYAVYYVRNVMPEKIREARMRPQVTARPAAAVPAEPKAIAITSRRDARRDRKRKGR
jgi:uncharacterized membrane protein YfcA